MLPPALWSPVVETMSFPLGNSGPPDRMEDYMDPVDPRWPSVESSPFIGVTHPYTTAAHGSVAVLTPISLADSAYLHARPSPVLSQHSQDYSYQGLDDAAVQTGLGISAPYQELASSSFGYPASLDLGSYGSDRGFESPLLHRSKRRRPTSLTSPPRHSPVAILPHPDGLQRLEQERRHGPVLDAPQREPPRSRTSARGRRDPQGEEEDAFVESLRAQNLSWKIVAEMFRERFGKSSTEARLQMRMLRRRKSAAAWQEADIALLLEAHNYWQSQKYNIISFKLQELGATRTYTEQQIEAQLHLLYDDDAGDPSPLPEPESRRVSKKRNRSLDDE